MTNTKTVLQVIAKMSGADHHAISAATGMCVKTTQRALETLRASKKVMVARFGRTNYYFSDQAQHDAGIAEVTARYARARVEAKRITAEKDAARALAKYHGTKTLSGELPGPKASKPPTSSKPIKLSQPKPMNKEKAARIKWAAQVAHTPAGVRVQQCPGFTGKHRYEAEPNSYGMGLMVDWEQKRRAA